MSKNQTTNARFAWSHDVWSRQKDVFSYTKCTFLPQSHVVRYFKLLTFCVVIVCWYVCLCASIVCKLCPQSHVHNPMRSAGWGRGRQPSACFRLRICIRWTYFTDEEMPSHRITLSSLITQQFHQWGVPVHRYKNHFSRVSRDCVCTIFIDDFQAQTARTSNVDREVDVQCERRAKIFEVVPNAVKDAVVVFAVDSHAFIQTERMFDVKRFALVLVVLELNTTRHCCPVCAMHSIV